MSDTHVIFGTGPLGRYTAESLIQMGHTVKLINRSGTMASPPIGAELIKADALTVSGSSGLFKDVTAIYQCSQPAYHRWKEEFPQLQDAILKIAIQNKAKLIVAENLYMYGNTFGNPVSEFTLHNPCTRKGKVRSEMSKKLFEAHKNGIIRAAAVRGSDFFGPWEPINGEMIFKAAIRRKTINLLGSLYQPHTFTYVKDFGKALATAGTNDSALGKVWHVPSGPAFTQEQILEIIARHLGYKLKYRVNGKMMLSLIGLFNPGAKEVVEMMYEFNSPFVMNSMAMQKKFGLKPTPMEQRITETLDWARTQL